MKTKRNPQNFRVKRKSGQALVEMLVAVSILALGISGITKVLVFAMQVSTSTRDDHVCIQLVNNRLERIDQADFGDVMMWEERDQVVNSQGLPDSHGNYQVSTQISYPDQSNTNYAEVVVSISTRNRATLKFDGAAKKITTFTADL